MRRADRLFEIIQVLRRASGPVTADAIASELEVNKRTVYRDVAALIAQRVPITGEAGIGYVLESGFDMPPLMLTADEAEAVALGAQWVAVNADPGLARAARAVLAKVATIVPEQLQALIDDPVAGTPPTPEKAPGGVDVGRLRTWCREGRKLTIRYCDEQGRPSERTIRPFMVGYVTGTRAVIAWCELRDDFRVFLTDRIEGVTFLDDRYPDWPAALRRRWLRLARDRDTVSTSIVTRHPEGETR